MSSWGRLIPAGTGLTYHDERRKARQGLQLEMPEEVAESVEPEPETGGYSGSQLR